MNELEQKNCVLICTCIIVICFHLAFKFKENQKFFYSFIGVGFFISLLMTKLLRDWEKENKTDYNLVLFLYIILDFVIFFYLVYKYISHRRTMTGGGNDIFYNSQTEPNQDILVKALNSDVGLKFLDFLKDNIEDFAIEKIKKFTNIFNNII